MKCERKSEGVLIIIIVIVVPYMIFSQLDYVAPSPHADVCIMFNTALNEWI